MDELEMLRATGQVDDPRPEAVQAHRAALARAMAAVGDTPDEAMATERPVVVEIGEAAGRRDVRRRRVMAVAAAAVLVAGSTLAIGGFLAARDSNGGQVLAGEGDTDGDATPPTAAPGSGEGSTLAAALGDCADGLRLAPPADYEGPLAGPSGDATAELVPTAEQHVVHWQGPTGSIELRWPGTRTDEAPDRSTTDDGGPQSSSVLSFDQILQPGAPRPGVRADILADGSAADCAVVELYVFDDDPEAGATLLSDLASDLYDPGPLVVGSRDAESVPAAMQCDAPAGTPVPPNRNGVGDGSTAATPEAALASFLETQDTFAGAGYTELRLPDGSIAYANEYDDGQAPIVVHVVETDAGWTVQAWETSGC